MKKWLLVCAVLLPLVAAVAAAKSRFHVDGMTVDGQEVRDLVCDLDEGGAFAALSVVATLAKQKKTLDACAPAGAAFAVKWTWAESGKADDVAATASSDPARAACVVKALRLTQAKVTGSCTAVVLVGKPEAARKAAEKLGTKVERR